MPANNLTGSSPAATRAQLLHIGTGTPGVAVIRTGDGTATALELVPGGLKINGTLNVTAPLIFSVTDTLSGAGAIPATSAVTLYTSTAASQALTLADGTHGQLKTIVHAVDGGSGILTPATKTGYTTITFTGAGDSATLMFLTTRGWVIIGTRGVTVA
jgi:hypothetical protein